MSMLRAVAADSLGTKRNDAAVACLRIMALLISSFSLLRMRGKRKGKKKQEHLKHMVAFAFPMLPLELVAGFGRVTI